MPVRWFDVVFNDSGVLFNVKLVENPVLRVLVGGLGVLVIGFGVIATGLATIALMAGVMLLITVLFILSPIWLPINYALQHYGRKGFIIRVHGSPKIRFSRDSFRKVGSS